MRIAISVRTRASRPHRALPGFPGTARRTRFREENPVLRVRRVRIRDRDPVGMIPE